MLDVFTMRSSALPLGTRVVGFRGSEGLARLYAFVVHLTLNPDAADTFELPSAAGAAASLVLDRQDGRPPFVFHGIFSELAFVHQQRDGRALVRAVLVPRLWRLTQTHHSRIFTQQSITDIIKKTLEDGGLTSSRLQPAAHRAVPARGARLPVPREQLRLHLALDGARGALLLLRAGRRRREAHHHRPQVCAREPRGCARALLRALGRGGPPYECLQTFVCRHRTLPASVRIKDYDYASPSLDVSGTAPVSKTGQGEISVHGARFFTPDAGKRLARLRAEELLAREQLFTASGNAFYLRAGYTFTLQDHPRSSFDAEYLVTEVEHYGNQSASTPELKRLTGLAVDEVYRVDVTAIPSSSPVSSRRANGMATHLRHRARGRRRRGRQRLRAARRPRALRRSVCVRRERPRRTARRRRGCG